MILYKPPTLWGLLRGAAINLLLPFINGLMLGFGELFAHEAAFRLGWGGTKVRNCALSSSSIAVQMRGWNAIVLLLRLVPGDLLKNVVQRRAWLTGALSGIP
jgi:hypothetical protein